MMDLRPGDRVLLSNGDWVDVVERPKLVATKIPKRLQRWFPTLARERIRMVRIRPIARPRLDDAPDSFLVSVETIIAWTRGRALCPSCRAPL